MSDLFSAINRILEQEDEKALADFRANPPAFLVVSAKRTKAN